MYKNMGLVTMRSRTCYVLRTQRKYELPTKPRFIELLMVWLIFTIGIEAKIQELTQSIGRAKEEISQLESELDDQNSERSAKYRELKKREFR